jgi:hypothetical protein
MGWHQMGQPTFVSGIGTGRLQINLVIRIPNTAGVQRFLRECQYFRNIPPPMPRYPPDEKIIHILLKTIIDSPSEKA